MKSILERREKPEEQESEPSSISAESKKRQPLFPPRAVQFGRHWKLLLALAGLIVVFVLGRIIAESDAFLLFFS